jgi:hypothetical protein
MMNVPLMRNIDGYFQSPQMIVFYLFFGMQVFVVKWFGVDISVMKEKLLYPAVGYRRITYHPAVIVIQNDLYRARQILKKPPLRIMESGGENNILH